MGARRRRSGARFGAAAGLCAVAAGLPGGFAAAADEPAADRTLTLRRTLAIQETFTDNARLSATDRESDLVTRALVGVEAELVTRRSEGRVSADVSYDAYARNNAMNGWSVGANGAGRLDLIDDKLSIRASGAVTNGGMPTFAGPATDREGVPGRVRLATYSVGPELNTRVANRVTVGAAARLSQVLYSSRDDNLALPDDDTIVQLVGRAGIGDAAHRLELRTAGQYLRDNEDYRASSAIQSATVRAIRGVRLIARAGYERITQTDVLRLRAPILSAGIEYRPNEKSVITVEGGRRYHRPAWTAQANVQLSSHVFLTGGYSRILAPDQVATALAFQEFASSADTLPAPVAPTRFAFNSDFYNEVSLYRTGVVRAAYVGEVNTLSLSGDWTDRSFIQAGGRDRTLITNLAYGRRVRPDVDLAVRANYVRTFESRQYGKSRGYGGAVQLAYHMNPTTDVSASLARTHHRQLGGNGERVSENAFAVALRRTF